jgi:spermidine synthase
LAVRDGAESGTAGKGQAAVKKDGLADVKQVPGPLPEGLDALEADHDYLLDGAVFTLGPPSGSIGRCSAWRTWAEIRRLHRAGAGWPWISSWRPDRQLMPAQPIPAERKGDSVGRRFEEIDWRETPMGAISLRRRLDPKLNVDVYEVKLNDEYLMSSLFTVAEVELARLALAELHGTDLDVVVGGLGLGYTAAAVLDDPRVRTLTVVEALGEVICWHRSGVLPLASRLTGDPRSCLTQGDFFAMVNDPAGFDPGRPGRRFDAVLVDIDHSPRHVLHPSHGAFYTPAGLRRLAGHLRAGGVFALWSDDPPDDRITAMLGEVFVTARAHVVRFANHLTGGEAANTVYVAGR